ncbi:MAG: S-layer protein, partial [Planctomycetota bacterium]|nr:S-layer protein [Planctomycetota bacterium]
MRITRLKAKEFASIATLFVMSFFSFVDNAAAQDSITILSPGKTIELKDAFAGWQIIANAGQADVTRVANYKSTNPKVARVDEKGFVEPVGDGQATIHVTHQGKILDVPVEVSGVSNGRPIDFRTEIVPLLSKLGCNAGGCHGKASGQNGFKLSLFGFDADFDFESIVNEGRGRRVFPANPEMSLFIQKASGQMPHGGGKRLVPDSNDYQIVKRWIAAGTPPVAKNVPIVKRIQMIPNDRIYKHGDTQQVAVIAEYTDGSFRDVTRQSEFASNLDVIAVADATGFIKAGKLSGEAAVMGRHMGH